MEKPEPHEVRRLVRERAERHVAELARAIGQRGHERDARALAAAGLVDDERADFGDLGAERRQLAAADDGVVRDRDDEAAGVRLDVLERPRQQVARRSGSRR